MAGITNPTDAYTVPSVSIATARTGASSKANALGMRAYGKRRENAGEQAGFNYAEDDYRVGGHNQLLDSLPAELQTGLPSIEQIEHELMGNSRVSEQGSQ